MKITIAIIGILSLLLLLGYLVFPEQCKKGHYEMVHHDQWTQFIPMTIGKVVTQQMIVHPAYDSNDFICDL